MDVFGLFLMGKPVGLRVGVHHGSGIGCWRDTHGFTRAIAYLELTQIHQSIHLIVTYQLKLIFNIKMRVGYLLVC